VTRGLGRVMGELSKTGVGRATGWLVGKAGPAVSWLSDKVKLFDTKKWLSGRLKLGAIRRSDSPISLVVSRSGSPIN